MTWVKQIVKTFVWGGCIGVAAQTLMLLFELFGFSPLFVAMGTLFTLGVIGCVVFAADMYGHVEKTGSSVAFLPFSGLGAAVAGAFLSARESGDSILKALAASWRFFFIATGVGIGTAIVVGVVVAMLA